jgi:hypothetical protein
MISNESNNNESYNNKSYNYTIDNDNYTFNCDRTSYNRSDTFSDTNTSKNIKNIINKNDNNILLNNNNNNQDNNSLQNIYRYKFTQEFMDELYIFSKIHQYDHRKDFKDAWLIWKDENETIIEEEINRLTSLGYEGNILDKMFKSARYYFRKKIADRKEPRQRNPYVGLKKETIEMIDKHIISIIQINKPADGFLQFCHDESNLAAIKEEISNLLGNGYKDHLEIRNKIKKTYKNRYFILKNK